MSFDFDTIRGIDILDAIFDIRGFKFSILGYKPPILSDINFDKIA